jgi:outer membrane protein assembly factor BamB
MHLLRPLLAHAALPALLFSCCLSPADDWPQWLGPRRDGEWRETGILEKFPPGGPRVLWRVPVGPGFAGPAVADGRVYLTDRVPAQDSARPASAFDRARLPGEERVLCLSEDDGHVLWQYSYDCPYTISYGSGPRATPLVSGKKVYTLGAEVDLLCFDAESGRKLWGRDLKKDYGAATPTWGFAAHPLLDGPRLICLVGGEKSVAVAFDKDTGKEIWRALSAKEPGYSPPTLIQVGERRQLIIWHPESVNALEPETGKVYWSQPFTARSGLSVPTPRQAGDRLFVTAFYEGGLMLKLAADPPGATILWQGKKHSERDTDTLHSIMPTPFLEDGYIYGVCSYGQLRCLRADTGERVWETLAATTPNGKETRWANAFLIKNGSRYFLFNEQGDLIIARLTPKGYEELSRARLLEPTNPDPGRRVVWSHPAFAQRCVFVRNDRELLRASLAAEP